MMYGKAQYVQHICFGIWSFRWFQSKAQLRSETFLATLLVKYRFDSTLMTKALAFQFKDKRWAGLGSWFRSDEVWSTSRDVIQKWQPHLRSAPCQNRLQRDTVLFLTTSLLLFSHPKNHVWKVQDDYAFFAKDNWTDWNLKGKSFYLVLASLPLLLSSIFSVVPRTSWRSVRFTSGSWRNPANWASMYSKQNFGKCSSTCCKVSWRHSRVLRY